MRRFGARWLLAAVLGGGCQAQVESDEVLACDPLAASTKVQVEYAAQLGDGRLLVVLLPRDFDDYSEGRVFFGPPDHVDERTLISFVRQKDGGTTNIEFEVDGATGHALFPVQLMDDQFTPGPPELNIDSQRHELELLARESPQNASYYCSK